MRKTVEIDGRPVEFLSTAAIPRLYRIKFKRDIFADMQAISKEISREREENSHLSLEALTLFENVAFIMAKHANGTAVPDSPEEWLEGFEAFSIYAVFPTILELWAENLRQINDTQKK